MTGKDFIALVDLEIYGPDRRRITTIKAGETCERIPPRRNAEPGVDAMALALELNVAAGFIAPIAARAVPSSASKPATVAPADPAATVESEA